MKDITELENPNSVQQMKQWLSDNGLETDSLGKKVVAELIKPPRRSCRPYWNFVSSLPSPPSGNIRRWNVLSAMTAELAACSCFTEPTAPDAGQEG
jgi:carbonic anhydrase